MAIVILGKSQCALCCKTLTKNDEIVALPAISDTANLLYQYFDQGFHKSCFYQWNKKEEIKEALQKEQNEFEKSDFYKEMLCKYGK